MYEETKTLDALNQAPPVVTERFLTFMSDNLVFGISTNNVIEILPSYTVRNIPTVPDYIMGVLNLRGQIVPVIDLRLRMNKPYAEPTSNTCVVILEYEESMMGIVVDSVLQVIDINISHFSPIPIDNHIALTESMVSLEDETIVLRLDVASMFKPE